MRWRSKWSRARPTRFAGTKSYAPRQRPGGSWPTASTSPSWSSWAPYRSAAEKKLLPTLRKQWSGTGGTRMVDVLNDPHGEVHNWPAEPSPDLEMVVGPPAFSRFLRNVLIIFGGLALITVLLVVVRDT